MINFKQKLEEEDRQARIEKGEAEMADLLKGSKKRKRFVTYTIAIIIIGLIFSGRVLMSSQNSDHWFPSLNIFTRVKHLVGSDSKDLQGESEDRINILLLGMGGKNHDGGYLTDTIMLASLKPSTKQVALISIPRDMAVPLNGQQRKINNINAFAEQKQEGSGGEATKQAVGEVLGLNIHYYIRVDFDGFMKVIDEIGGVEVCVENTFDDYSYPIRGQEDNPNYYARFEHLHIEQGCQKMDGSLALKYARSRHALGGEGSDFARARRQQLILQSVKDKLLSRQTLLNPIIIGKLVSEFNANVSTDLKVWEIAKLWEAFKDTDKSKIINQVLNDAPDNYLISTTGYEGAYLLVPKTGNFKAIQNMIAEIFGPSVSSNGIAQETENKNEDTPRPLGSNAKIAIMNGSWVSGLASKTAAGLEKYNFKISQISNAPERDYTNPVVYDLSYGRKNESLKTLKSITGAEESFDYPSWVQEYSASSSKPDFILVLGENSKNIEE